MRRSEGPGSGGRSVSHSRQESLALGASALPFNPCCGWDGGRGFIGGRDQDFVTPVHVFGTKKAKAEVSTPGAEGLRGPQRGMLGETGSLGSTSSPWPWAGPLTSVLKPRAFAHLRGLELEASQGADPGQGGAGRQLPFPEKGSLTE